VDVGQFLRAFSGEVYDFYSVSSEYFGYILVDFDLRMLTIDVPL
jgi:hypothetical protein